VCSTAIVSSPLILLASLACEGASSLFLSSSSSFSSSSSRMPMLMKETRLTRQKSIAEILTRDIGRERENLYGTRRERESEGEFDIARNESFQLGRTSSETHTHTHTQHSLFPISLSFGFFYCVVYALCLSSRAEHIA
jgi:hypothetical protein